MTIGIYILYWEHDDRYYIGKSQNIEKRYKDHINSLNRKDHHSFKLQDLYNVYNTNPLMYILETCTLKELNFLEDFWIKEFNSIDMGLNVAEGGSLGAGSGVNASGSIYSKLQILLSFRLLRNNKLYYKDIEKITGVSPPNLSKLSRKERHVWVWEKYPNIGKKVEDANILRSSGYKIKSGYLLSPDGVVYQYNSIADFARIHNLNQGHLNQLILGKSKTHKGWKVYNV